HENVAGVATDDEVLHLGEEGQAVRGEVALDEPTVSLQVQRRKNRLNRAFKPGVDPRRGSGQVDDWTRPEQQRGNDPLRPRGARLVWGCDDDVVISRDEPVPTRAVEVMVPVLATSLRSAAHQQSVGTADKPRRSLGRCHTVHTCRYRAMY